MRRSVARQVFMVVMFAGSVLIARASLPYFFGDEVHEFIVEKLPLPHEAVWLAALRIHVVAAVFSLPACVLLLSSWFLRKTPRFHRILGRVVGAVVVMALVPSGAWLALYAKGGVAGTAGFLLSGAIVGWAMVRGIVEARAGRVVAHRRFMLHVVAQLSVAVTSRTLLVGLDLAGIDPEKGYLMALWGPVVASVVIVELITGAARARRQHEALPRRDVVRPAVGHRFA